MRARRVVVWVLASLGLAHCGPAHDLDDFRVGATQDALLDQFGQPDRVGALRKTEGHVFGPIETFWAEVPMDAQIEIWFYTLPEGTVELYFVEGVRAVAGKGFAPEGAVF